MIIEYTHPELGEDIQGRAGFYTAVEELTMPYNGREVLYVMGTARLERPCCGGACCWGYIQVPGFLVRKHIRGKGSTSRRCPKLRSLRTRKTATGSDRP